jgi:hypothetical protein
MVNFFKDVNNLMLGFFVPYRHDRFVLCLVSMSMTTRVEAQTLFTFNVCLVIAETDE